MKESLWAAYIVIFGIVVITFIFIMQNITNTDEHNMAILKETTKAAMYDAFDYSSYRSSGTIRIDREKYVEAFLRRFAENAAIDTYKIKIYDVNETPPKVSIQVVSHERGVLFGGTKDSEVIDFTISNRIDAILESPYQN